MTPTDQIQAICQALGWEYTETENGGKVNQRGVVSTGTTGTFYLYHPHDLDAFLKAAEAALSQEQSREYGLELARRVPIMPGGLTGDMYFAIASAPAEVRLRALRAVCDRSPHTAGRGRWNQR